MAFLMKAKKADLILLAQELGKEIPSKVTIIELKGLICASSHYEEETIKILLETIMNDRKEGESEAKLREKELREHELMREKELREHELLKEKELREHELRLKELELKQKEGERTGVIENSTNNVSGNELMKYLNLVRDQLPKAPQRTENWIFFFHQAETIFAIYAVPEEYWGKIILHRLADLVRSLSNSIGLEKLADYKAIKECVLAENRLTPLQHKKNLENCNKRFQENHIQWASRIRTSLDYYLESREVTTIQTLKDLIISDKMKDMVPHHVRAHILIKEGTNWLKPNELANEIDMYLEAQPKINQFKNTREENFKIQKPCENREENYSKLQINGKENNNEPVTIKENLDNVKKPVKKQIRCWECSQEGHYRSECVKLKDQKENEMKINQVWINLSMNVVKPEILKSQGERNLPTVQLVVGGNKIEAIKDSGAQISVFKTDLIPEKFRKGGKIYLVPAVGQKERADLVTLPISLSRENQGIVPEIEILAALTPNLNCPALITPVAYDALVKQAESYKIMIDKETEGEYKLGENQMSKNGDMITNRPSEKIKGGETFSLVSGEVPNEILPSSKQLPDEANPNSDNTSDGTEIVSETGLEGGEIAEVDRDLSELFRQQQRECPGLERLWKEGRLGKNNYFIEDGLLYHQSKIVNESRKQLVVPECRRLEILKVTHNHLTDGHVAVEKILERIKLSFFWELVGKDVKRYCSSWEEYQLRRKVLTTNGVPSEMIVMPKLLRQVVYADLFGPTEPSSAGGHSYELGVVNQYRRGSKAVPVKSWSACQIMYGRVQNGPQTQQESYWEGETGVPAGINLNPSEYLEQLWGKLQPAVQVILNVLVRKQADYMHRYNLRSSGKQFNFEDELIVWIPDSLDQIDSRWKGPGIRKHKKPKPSDTSWIIEEKFSDKLNMLLYEVVELNTSGRRKLFVIAWDESELAVEGSISQGINRQVIRPTFSLKWSNNHEGWSLSECEIPASKQFEAWGWNYNETTTNERIYKIGIKVKTYVRV